MLKEQVQQLREALLAEQSKNGAMRAALTSAQAAAASTVPLLSGRPSTRDDPRHSSSGAHDTTRPVPGSSDPRQAQRDQSALPGVLMRLEPIKPSTDECLFLDTFFSYIVRNFPIVDKEQFYQALKRSGEQPNSVTVSMDAAGAKTRL